jgi:DNA-binding transcriptional ArsR family regulator/anti-sigma regulatory factor (Ser/Thr protein kinase)
MPLNGFIVTNKLERGKAIRDFLLRAIAEDPREIVRRACEQFGASRQAVTQHLRQLVDAGVVVACGNTRSRTYALATLTDHIVTASLAGLAEDVLWRTEVRPLLDGLAANVLDIWQYACTEMVNNAVDHSGGSRLQLVVTRNAVYTRMLLSDDGVGIFRKIQQECHLDDERHAVLELAKGKLTTDPKRHTGEGIFFASRLLDQYAILSGGVYFSHTHTAQEDWILESERPSEGTLVSMALANASPRTSTEIFDAYTATTEDFGFTKTVVPVRLAKHGEENLISRSQAKRLVARVDRFKVVVLDFTGVDTIGQAFADEIFRVFAAAHPAVEIVPVFAGPAVSRMIARARAAAATPANADPGAALG